MPVAYLLFRVLSSHDLCSFCLKAVFYVLARQFINIVKFTVCFRSKRKAFLENVLCEVIDLILKPFAIYEKKSFWIFAAFLELEIQLVTLLFARYAHALFLSV